MVRGRPIRRLAARQGWAGWTEVNGERAWRRVAHRTAQADDCPKLAVEHGSASRNAGLRRRFYRLVPKVRMGYDGDDRFGENA